MLKLNNGRIKINTVPGLSKGAVQLDAGSFVYDNKWINFNGSIFIVKDYIDSVLKGNRARFFKDRNYAVFLLIGLDPNKGVSVAEGRHVLFSTLQAVPPPESFSFLPLAGVILIQDGSRDLNYGYVPLKDENIVSLSGYGNILNKNLKGDPGENSYVYGETGLIGETGIRGFFGAVGATGNLGVIGVTDSPPQGYTGLGGMTGISWSIHIPFEQFF